MPLIRITSIITNEYIPANKTVIWSTLDVEFVYMEALDSVQVGCDISNAILGPNDCALGQNLTLCNSNHNVACIRAIRLHVEPEIVRRLVPIISPLQPLEAGLLKNLFSPLFHDQSLIEKIEELADGLFDRGFKHIQSDSEEMFLLSNNKIDPRLIKINQYLITHCEENITLHNLADLIQCNPVYLSNRYSKVFHISPIKHLQTMKMEKAKKLLCYTDMYISEVAQRLGYISASQFTNLFKRHFGITPLLFRKKSKLIDNNP
ncbi:helix-turn-helix transcriptional regulator [Paenibacillus sp. DRB1-1]|uniref:helix-turn-helix transcriptional regulator n=1 Tax=Paenibacillus sp. DRB1-1 TaxID=3422309 RepID=UPI001A051F6C|nr:helix-turn-helix transcriptional regulator [Paenibacillus sp. EKM208P]